MNQRANKISPDQQVLDAQAVRRHFGRACASYDRAANLQAEVRAELLERAKLLFKPIDNQPPIILDLGAGTGTALPALRAIWPAARLLAIDAAAPMVAAANNRAVIASASLLGKLRRIWQQSPAQVAICADAAALPLATASVDLVFSNLMLQWCDPPDAALREIARVLKPGAVVVFSTFGPDTLRELRAAWATVDDHAHVSRFLDMHDVGDALARQGLREPVLDVDRLQTTHGDVPALMRHLKDIGARNASRGRNHALTGRRKFTAMCAAYPHNAENSDIHASWEVIYASAFGAGPRSDGFAVDASELTDALRRRRASTNSDAEQ